MSVLSAASWVAFAAAASACARAFSLFRQGLDLVLTTMRARCRWAVIDRSQAGAARPTGIGRERFAAACACNAASSPRRLSTPGVFRPSRPRADPTRILIVNPFQRSRRRFIIRSEPRASRSSTRPACAPWRRPAARPVAARRRPSSAPAQQTPLSLRVSSRSWASPLRRSIPRTRPRVRA